MIKNHIKYPAYLALAALPLLGFSCAAKDLIPTETPIQCEQLITDSDHNSLAEVDLLQQSDYDGATGAWTGPDGRIFGYSTEEDSIIYNRPDCYPLYEADPPADR